MHPLEKVLPGRADRLQRAPEDCIDGPHRGNAIRGRVPLPDPKLLNIEREPQALLAALDLGLVAREGHPDRRVQLAVFAGFH
jgi:hypothetical protein